MTLRNLLPYFVGSAVFLSACQPSNDNASTTDGLTLIQAQRIYTMNPSQPLVEAMVYDAMGAIVATGSLSDLQLQYPNAELQDFGQGTVIPA